ncbi:uncharacterized protein [Physcomitrium patens]|uniref:BTB domain-containing protein n=1 Tax=Physcomitrium patens TaxID=3218 RepID=A9SCI9_PHYPA|nr:BTB/POZ domain-containing protein KCTD5-like [Physcomitrium patens]XP_024400783.1 BTB/POZ domain-containing protein KCTD5-like [Physcomitrium patens]PNR36526.1 hypothetical protein PHYPA_022377 [Physcomitrium patens]|eukprot:XP_024400782.1 BTB/POZ domain-containing protein KCTD5-like [Physcomitrella patens]
MTFDKLEDANADPCVLHPFKRKAEGYWRQVKEEINDKIVVNVGGTCFETSRQTLCLDSKSMFSTWLSRHHTNNCTLWIDRDAERFRHVLNYLRNGTVWLNDIPSLHGLREEADFFGLEGLKSLCDDLVQDLEKKKEEKSKKWSIQLRGAIRDVLEDYQFPAANTCKDQMLGAPTSRYRWRIEPVFQTDLDF